MAKHAAGQGYDDAVTAPIPLPVGPRTRRGRRGLLAGAALGLSLASGVAGAAAVGVVAATHDQVAPAAVQATPTVASPAPVSSAVPTTSVAPRSARHAATSVTTTHRTVAAAVTTRSRPASTRRSVSTTCDLAGPPVFGDPGHPDVITNRDCGYTDARGRARSRDPWIDDQLTSSGQ